jgi:enoyl-CoA hydratase
VTHLEIERHDEIALLALRRGKVNAINEELVRELRAALDELVVDPRVRGIVLTGRGAFFSFGLDVPELYPLSGEAFARFLAEFTSLYTRLYTYPKPVIAALNGHAIAGGCMLALACDRRVMTSGPAKIGLNEATFGSSVFAGSVEMLEACVGHGRAETILLSGGLFDPPAAAALGLADQLVPREGLPAAALAEARALADRPTNAYTALKRLLRGPVAERMRRREADSIREFVQIWYSEETRGLLREIVIRS